MHDKSHNTQFELGVFSYNDSYATYGVHLD